MTVIRETNSHRVYNSVWSGEFSFLDLPLCPYDLNNSSSLSLLLQGKDTIFLNLGSDSSIENTHADH